jgi:protein associated with RNAse G/E
MFTNSFISYFIRGLIRFIYDEEHLVLPLTIEDKNVKCLDFDIDNVRFKCDKFKKVSFDVIQPEKFTGEFEEVI